MSQIGDQRIYNNNGKLLIDLTFFILLNSLCLLQSSDHCPYPVTKDISRANRSYEERGSDGFISDLENKTKKRVTLRL